MVDNGRIRDREDKSPWTQPGFLAAGAVVALLVALGLILVVTGGSDDEPQPGTTNAAPAPAPPAGQDADASVCGLPAGSQAVPTEAPPTQWELVGGIAAPTSTKAFGPGVVTEGLRSCFAHSPTGALYAAANVIAMTASADHREAFVRRMTVPGVGRDRALRNLGPESDSATLQIAGFSVRDYRTSSVVVDLAFRVDAGRAVGYTHLPLALRWLDGDWKLALPDTGQPFDAMTRVPSIAGYIAWKAS